MNLSTESITSCNRQGLTESTTLLYHLYGEKKNYGA